MKRLIALVLAALLTSAIDASAQSADDQYLNIYRIIQDAESLAERNQNEQALSRFVEARGALQRFQRGYPEWTPEVVKFRLDYLGSRISALSAKTRQAMPPEARPPQAPGQPQAEKPEPSAAEAQLATLSNQVRQLQSDKALLENKLKEALAAQPAALDPKQLAQAEERVKALQKEVDLLNVALADERAKPGVTVDTNALAKARQALEDANRQLAQEKETSARLAREKEALQASLKSAGSDSAVSALRAENEQLRKQLIAAQTAQAPEPVDKKAEKSRIKALERERDQLEKQLASARKDAEKGRRGKKGDTQAQELQNELAAARARLQVVESKPVPYTPEELAMMRTTPATLPGAGTATAAMEPTTQLPPAAATLIAEARRDFSARNFDQAENKYRQVVSQAPNNPSAITDLATVQMERGNLDDAEKTVRQALVLTPENPYALSILGQVKFRQKQYDEALDALSRAAKADPKNAEVQNWLGVTLSEKGMRAPAEAALRKAIQLQPGYSQAHNNLAVVYATQKPPMRELALWHYQKARAGGQPQNTQLEKLLAAPAQ